jgi:hypothetical protein
MAPGTDPDLFALALDIRGGYRFGSIPLYIGIDVPLSYYKYTETGGTSAFSIGDIGLGVKYRLDPALPGVDVYVGLRFDLYFPSAWTTSGDKSAALGMGMYNSLLPALWDPKAFSLVLGFDVILPGEYLYFQFDLTAVGSFPADDREFLKDHGYLLWGAALGVFIIDELIGLVEFKGLTPFYKDSDEYTPPNLYSIGLGFRMSFGPFKPGVWVAFPLNSDYRDNFPDVIIGIDLAAWF